MLTGAKDAPLSLCGHFAGRNTLKQTSDAAITNNIIDIISPRPGDYNLTSFLLMWTAYVWGGHLSVPPVAYNRCQGYVLSEDTKQLGVRFVSFWVR
jgi:hypothetical protein